MMRFVVGFLFCVAVASATEFRTCDNGQNGPVSVDVSGCDVLPCLFVPGTTLEANVTFISPFPSDNLLPQALVTIFGITTEFPLLDPDACAYLIAGAICPLAQGAQSTYQLVIFIDPLWPPAPSMTIEFSLLDNFGNGETVVCTELDGTFRP